MNPDLPFWSSKNVASKHSFNTVILAETPWIRLNHWHLTPCLLIARSPPHFQVPLLRFNTWEKPTVSWIMPWMLWNLSGSKLGCSVVTSSNNEKGWISLYIHRAPESIYQVCRYSATVARDRYPWFILPVASLLRWVTLPFASYLVWMKMMISQRTALYNRWKSVLPHNRV